MSGTISRARCAGAAICIAVALLAGCAGLDDSSRWIGRSGAEGEARVAYVAAARAKVYSAPDASSQVEGVLNLDEKVARYQSEGGFAYVEAAGNVAGWVVEKQLAASRARRPAAAPQPTATPPSAPEAQVAPKAQPAPAEEPVPDDEPALEGEPEPSVFDPY